MIAKASMSGNAHDSLKYHDFCAFVNRHVFLLLFFLSEGLELCTLSQTPGLQIEIELIELRNF